MAMETGERIAKLGECDLITESLPKLIRIKAKSKLAVSLPAYDSLYAKDGYS